MERQEPRAKNADTPTNAGRMLREEGARQARGRKTVQLERVQVRAPSRSLRQRAAGARLLGP